MHTTTARAPGPPSIPHAHRAATVALTALAPASWGESLSLPQTLGFALALAALLAAQLDVPARGGPAEGPGIREDQLHDDEMREGRTR
ncbi:hypothetical protein [Streptomyces sp. SCL15-6]|jgi:hypothetical protein|uniref:hypothetical protein n=1 Tax=Streptomyces sp. SCL15-6 TaxID=2967222 RepID=UPI0029666BBC|nr:hypothetical protein [Streptomyces sp. SCL15-6]